MKRKDFLNTIDVVYTRLKELTNSKGEEYKGAEDNQFGNFERYAQHTGMTREQALSVCMYKHLEAIDTYIRDCAAGRTRQRSESITGRVDDAILYLTLFRAMIEEPTQPLPAKGNTAEYEYAHMPTMEEAAQVSKYQLRRRLAEAARPPGVTMSEADKRRLILKACPVDFTDGTGTFKDTTNVVQDPLACQCPGCTDLRTKVKGQIDEGVREFLGVPPNLADWIHRHWPAIRVHRISAEEFGKALEDPLEAMKHFLFGVGRTAPEYGDDRFPK